MTVSAAVVCDLPVEVCHLAAGQIRRLAHRQPADGQIGCVGIGCGGDWRDRGRTLAVLKEEDHPARNRQNDGCRDGHRQPVALGPQRGAQVVDLCSRANCTPDFAVRGRALIERMGAKTSPDPRPINLDMISSKSLSIREARADPERLNWQKIFKQQFRAGNRPGLASKGTGNAIDP